MKIKRHKKVQKHLNFFVNNFKFRQPYQILIDGTFTFSALKNKFNIQEQIPKYLESEVKLLTSQCIIIELEKLGKKHYGALLVLKQFKLHKCGHEKNPKIGSKCLLSMVSDGNPSRYFVATQDRELQEQIRTLPGVPLMYLHGTAPNLEAPSKVSQDKAESFKHRILLREDQEETIRNLKMQSGIQLAADLKHIKKKKKGCPNPLSCKKKKKNIVSNMTSVDKDKKVRKRKRVKIPVHVREALKESIESKTA